MNEYHRFDARIKNRRLIVPDQAFGKLLEDMVGFNTVFAATFLPHPNRLEIRSMEMFVGRYQDLIRAPEWSEDVEKLRQWIFPHTEWTTCDDAGRVHFNPYALINLYGLPISKQSFPGTNQEKQAKAIYLAEKVPMLTKPDVLFEDKCIAVVLQEEYDAHIKKYQSTVNSSESCPTSNNPSRAPASSHP